MPDLTPNMGLEKPLDNETADIQVINSNMDKIDTAFADSAGKSQEIIDLIGTNTAPAGTTTLFARLAQLANYVDTLESLLGLNTDAAGTNSIFARLAQIAAYVDTLEAQLGTSGDGSSTTTLHGKIQLVNERLAQWLGNNTDAANPNGTANAKLKDIRNFLGSGSAVTSAVKGVKRGTSTYTTPSTGGGTINVTIPTVNMDKASLNVILGNVITSDIGYTYRLSSPTNIEILYYLGYSGQVITINWEVIEYV